MTTRRRVPRATTANFGSTVLLEGEIAYDQSLKRFRMGDGTTPSGELLATFSDTAQSILPPFGIYGSITGGTNPNNTYLMVIAAAVILRPEDGARWLVADMNISVSMTTPGPIKNGRDTNTALQANELGYVYLIGNSSTGEKALIASTAESWINVNRPAGFDFICTDQVCSYKADVGSNLRNKSIYGFHHEYVCRYDGNFQPVIASGVAGDPTVAGNYVTKSVAAYVPRLAHKIEVTIAGYNGKTKLCPNPDMDGSSNSGGGVPVSYTLANTGVSVRQTIYLQDYFDRSVFYSSNDPYAIVTLNSYSLSFGSLGQ